MKHIKYRTVGTDCTIVVSGDATTMTVTTINSHNKTTLALTYGNPIGHYINILLDNYHQKDSLKPAKVNAAILANLAAYLAKNTYIDGYNNK